MTAAVTTVSIAGPAYELGEQEVDHRDAKGFTDKIAEYRMPADPAAWGWGSFHRTERDRVDLALASAARTLAAAGIGGADVDAVLLCGTQLPAQLSAQAGYLRTVLTDLDLGHAFVVGVTLGRCNTMLTGITLARALVAGGTHHDVLVLAADVVTDEEDRFQGFALFSDAAASCLVTARPGPLEIRAAASVTDVTALDSGGRVDGNLARAAVRAVIDPCGLAPSDIATVLPSNLFVPIVRMNERQSGFGPSQLFLTNIAARGHCFSADPVVNLVDHLATGTARPGDHLLLNSVVPGARVSVLTRMAAPTTDRSHASRGVDNA